MSIYVFTWPLFYASFIHDLIEKRSNQNSWFHQKHSKADKEPQVPQAAQLWSKIRFEKHCNRPSYPKGQQNHRRTRRMRWQREPCKLLGAQHAEICSQCWPISPFPPLTIGCINERIQVAKASVDTCERIQFLMCWNHKVKTVKSQRKIPLFRQPPAILFLVHVQTVSSPDLPSNSFFPFHNAKLTSTLFSRPMLKP